MEDYLIQYNFSRHIENIPALGWVKILQCRGGTREGLCGYGGAAS